MPTTHSDGSTPRYCWAPEGMILATALPARMLKQFVESAGDLAIEHGEIVAVLGATLGCAGLPCWPTCRRGEHGCMGHFCRRACHLTHSGSVLVMPDLGVAEMYANSGPSVLASLKFVTRADGRSVAICSVA